MQFTKIYIVLFFSIFCFACNRTQTTKNAPISSTERFDFGPFKGIYYQEARRSFESGLAFNEMGFQQEPAWEIQFMSNDSVKALSPETNKLYNFYLHYDHANIYNFAREWFKLIDIQKDSIVFQRLEVKEKKIKSGIESDVYMKFYAKNYIKDSLKTTIQELRKPNKADSTYIRKMAAQVNATIDTNLHHNFAAREPVVFTSINNNIEVEKTSRNYASFEQSNAYSYLFPEYHITIYNAYMDFAFSFSAIVDYKGNMHLARYTAFEEFKASREKVIAGIINVYFKNLLKISPGTTLGIPHNSMVFINLTGNKNGR